MTLQQDFTKFVRSPRFADSIVERSVPQNRIQIDVATSIPREPVDGDEIFYVADDSNGVVWRFRYRASSTSSYKWEFVGGPPMYAEITTQETTVSAAYAALATAGPSLTIPLAGDYMVTTGCRALNATASVDLFMSYDIGATGAVDADAVYHNTGPGGVFTSSTGNYMRERRKTFSASTALVSKYKTSGGTAYFDARLMSIIPVRIGG